MPYWTTEKIEELKECAAAGISLARIAIRMKRPQLAIRVQARKLGIELKAGEQVREANGLDARWHVNRDR